MIAPSTLVSLQGYLAALSASAYSLISMVQRFGPHMNAGGAVISLTYNASNRIIPGYGGGMSTAKAVSSCNVALGVCDVGMMLWGLETHAHQR